MKKQQQPSLPMQKVVRPPSDWDLNPERVSENGQRFQVNPYRVGYHEIRYYLADGSLGMPLPMSVADLRGSRAS